MVVGGGALPRRGAGRVDARVGDDRSAGKPRRYAGADPSGETALDPLHRGGSVLGGGASPTTFPLAVGRLSGRPPRIVVAE